MLLGEVQVLPTPAVVVEVQRVGSLHQTGHTAVVGVEQVLEERNDQATVVVQLLLHLVGDDLALGVVGLVQRSLVVGLEGRVGRRPVIVRVRRGVLQAARGDLQQEVAGAPVVDGERALQVLIAPIGPTVDDLGVDRDPGTLGLFGKELDHLRQPGGVVRCEQIDRHPGLAGIGEELLGGVEILLALRKVLGVGGVERRVQVVGDSPVAGQHLLDHRVAVDDQAHRLADADIGERLLVDGHRDRQPATAGGVQHLVAVGALDGLHGGGRDVGGDVDLVGQQGVDQRITVGEVDDVHLVEVRLACVPVVRVLDVHRLLADLELLEHVRPGADLRGRVAAEALVAHGHDRAGVRAQGLLEVRHTLLELQLDGVVVDLGDARHVEHRAHDGAAVHLEGGVEHAGERVDHVVGRHRVAVAELDAVLQRDDVVVGGLGGDVLGDAVGVLGHEVGAEAHQRLPPGDLAHDVGLWRRCAARR